MSTYFIVYKIISFLRLKCSQTVDCFLLAFWYTVQGAQSLKWCNYSRIKQKQNINFFFFFKSIFGQNSLMLIDITVKSVFKSIVYLFFWYRYRYWLYDTDTIRYSIQPYNAVVQVVYCCTLRPQIGKNNICIFPTQKPTFYSISQPKCGIKFTPFPQMETPNSDP